jgi:hypothetical protein
MGGKERDRERNVAWQLRQHSVSEYGVFPSRCVNLTICVIPPSNNSKMVLYSFIFKATCFGILPSSGQRIKTLYKINRNIRTEYF